MNPPVPVTALCVDDNEDTCEMLTLLLRLWGIEVHSAYTAREALTVTRTKQFDVYLLDSWLPDLDGFQLCRKLRERTPRAHVLFFSGAVYDTDKQKAMEAGANGYVVKPNINELIEKLSTFVSEAGADGQTESAPESLSPVNAVRLHLSGRR